MSSFLTYPTQPMHPSQHQHFYSSHRTCDPELAGMAYPNDTYPYYDPFATGGWDTYPPPDVSPMAEPSYTQTPDSLAIGWEMAAQSVPRVGVWSDLYASAFQPTRG